MVYLRGVSGPDPNHYTLKGEVKVTGGVRLVLGLGFARILGGRFVTDDTSAEHVHC